MKRLFWAIFALAVLCFPFYAQAQVTWHDPAGTVVVHSVTLDGEEWLFLPSGSNLSSLTLEMDGRTETVDWTAVSAESEERPNVHAGLWQDTPLNVMVSQHLRSLHLRSDDPVNYGRQWLENCAYHENTTSASMVLIDEFGTSAYPLRIYELRGRGNSSWGGGTIGKRPYQFRLEDKADLLGTGLRHEYCRTWTLLTNADDMSLLRNQLALDIARELGMDSSSRCEQVDLYYDGEYRGTYLLAEKVEVGEHSVDITDFDGLLKPINELLRVPDPDLLGHPYTTGGHIPSGENEFGPYSHFDHVYDNQDLDAGGYLLELDGSNTMSERTWFNLPDGRYISFKNPEYAGPTMIRYIQEIFLKAYAAMLNHGVHPETGELLEDLIDIDSFTRSHLVQEIMHNSNAYFYASTFFVIPEGETRVYAGPVWDFDHVSRTPRPGLKDNNDMSHAFYRTTVFQRASKKLWAEEIEPMFANIFFGQQHGSHLKPMSAYRDMLRMSWQMNYYLYYGSEMGYSHSDERFEDNMDTLQEELEETTAFLQEEIFAWGEDEPTHSVDIYFELPYADPQAPLICEIDGEQYGSILLDTEFTCVQPATEEEFGVWQVAFKLHAKPNCTIPEDVTVYINSEEYPVTIVDNTITLVFEYVDYYYRPAIVDGVDYGHVFDYDVYTSLYPELEEQGLSREDIIRHFRDEGMLQGDCANEYFDPLFIFVNLYSACEMFGENWPLYYQQQMIDHLFWSEDMGYVYEPDWELIEN